jgi:hypothetical protein
VILKIVSGEMRIGGRKMGGGFGIFEERLLRGALIGYATDGCRSCLHCMLVTMLSYSLGIGKA